MVSPEDARDDETQQDETEHVDAESDAAEGDAAEDDAAEDDAAERDAEAEEGTTEPARKGFRWSTLVVLLVGAGAIIGSYLYVKFTADPIVGKWRRSDGAVEVQFKRNGTFRFIGPLPATSDSALAFVGAIEEGVRDGIWEWEKDVETPVLALEVHFDDTAENVEMKSVEAIVGGDKLTISPRFGKKPPPEEYKRSGGFF